DLPVMEGGRADEAEDMLCGGCGAKVSQNSLRAGLASTADPARSDVVQGIGDDAAILRIGDVRQVIAVDHLRAFTDDPWMLARIAAVHALGDIWAMGAAPQSGLLSVILPRMGEPMQAATIAEITDAAEHVLSEAGADLVGGHTSLGAEMTVGLTVTGLCERPPIGLDGARPGDKLILTKPIGTGVLLAGEMRALAKGDDVVAALESMSRPSAQASAILAPVAHAMTDVTGFGLAGHLMSILEASGLEATIDVDAIPLLKGVEDLAAQGIRSTIWQANAATGERMTLRQSARSDLLFDPQTAGGLLAAVPEGDAARTLEVLLDAGEPAALIGTLREGDPWIHVEGD
ncbi:MAG: selenide, water dikinase SelD, partial [Pseudomonadota bacterium]